MAGSRWTSACAIALVAASSTVTGCGSTVTRSTTPPSSSRPPLVRSEVAIARAAARTALAGQHARVSDATVVETPGTTRQSNTGRVCTSGHELLVTLIGHFPRMVTTGHPVEPGSPTPDFTVRAVVLRVDAASGQTCLVSVETAENGVPKPPRGAVPFSLG